MTLVQCLGPRTAGRSASFVPSTTERDRPFILRVGKGVQHLGVRNHSLLDSIVKGQVLHGS